MLKVLKLHNNQKKKKDPREKMSGFGVDTDSEILGNSNESGTPLQSLMISNYLENITF